ncbi:MAG TPA: anion transporter [Acetobacteraceae bacterium]
MPGRRGSIRIAAWTSVGIIGALVALTICAALVPRTLPRLDAPLHQIAAGAIFVASYLALAIGRVPGLSIDRAGIALVGGALMLASGAISLPDAYKAIDLGTLSLLLGMMLVVANLRLSGVFAIATRWVAGHARRPVLLLGAVILVSGIASAFLVNDAICLVLAPLVVDLAQALRRRPMPYLLAVAMASNIGSTATITGNPQNMLIGTSSGISYADFAASLGPIAAVGLIVLLGLAVLLHWWEFRDGAMPAPARQLVHAHPVLAARSLIATVAVIILFFIGVPPAEAAILIGALLLLTRRLRSARIYAEIDWSLLLMFAGLFVIVAAAEQQLLTGDIIAQAGRLHLDRTFPLTGITAVLSNLVSNVPAVLVLKPFVAALSDPRKAWKVIAMASTLAGNFTLLGSVANLIVAEKSAQRGVTITFWDYFRLGAPVTVLTLLIGAFWLG